jgi:TetR/AcrR family transcriptional repressor of nem operon
MARPRSFDPDQALDLVRDVFWQKGFQGTSLDDITAATGLAKPSLYAERIINDGPSARDAVHRWLTGFVPFCSGVKGKRGCLSINTSADGATEQKGVRKRVEAFNRKLEELLRDRLRADRTQFGEGFDPDAAAHTIMAIYTGLMVMAKDAPDAARVRATLDQVLKLLS